MANVLVVDNDEAIRDIVASVLKRGGHEVVKTASHDHAAKLVEKNAYDVVVAELNGMGIPKATRNIFSDAAVIMMADCNAAGTALEAMELGAWGYVMKPISLQQLSLSIDRALEKKRLAASAKNLRRQVMDKYTFKNVVADSEEMRQAVKLAKEALATHDPVLITGESGTGKQLFANIIHTASARRREPFIPVNFSCMDQETMERALFGFVSEQRSAKGAIERADRGTLFLNEITNAALETQEKLSEFLEYNITSRIGSEEMIYADTRLIAASSADAVRCGEFRTGLLRQLNPVLIHLSPLRERKDDILPLVDHFVRVYSERFGKQIHGISPESRSFFMAYDWGGNVRELKNAVERAVALANEEIISQT